MAKIDALYNAILRDIIIKGFRYEDPKRKGVFRKQITKYDFEYDLSDGFPLLTTKLVNPDALKGEFVGFLTGKTHVKDLYDLGVNFWFKDAYNRYKRLFYGKIDGIDRSEGKEPISFKEFVATIKDPEFNAFNDNRGQLGPIYSAQMRDWGEMVSIDQLQDLINELKVNPLGTKRTVTMWNPSDAREQALSCCHWAFEVLVEPTTRVEKILNSGKYYKLSIQWHQHSVDTFLGLPFNIAYYAMLTEFLANALNMVPHKLYGGLTNVHIYEPHIEHALTQLGRDINKYNTPDVVVNAKTLEELTLESIEISNYQHFPYIKAEMIPYDE